MKTGETNEGVFNDDLKEGAAGGMEEKGAGDSREVEQEEKKESKATNLKKRLSFKNFSFMRKKSTENTEDETGTEKNEENVEKDAMEKGDKTEEVKAVTPAEMTSTESSSCE